MNRFALFVFAATLCAAPLLASSAEAGQASSEASKPSTRLDDAPPLPSIELQAWEKRRYNFSELTKQLRAGDAVARKNFELIVKRFESTPFDLTPLESMDILGSVYVPQFGLQKMLPLVAAQAALGLYDAYRFASKVGQAELLVSEQFLSRPLVLAGEAQAAASRKFLQDNALLAEQLVDQGLRLAEGERNLPAYDPKWVAALDRTRQFCAQGSACAAPFTLPEKADWPQIWQTVRQQVKAYYRVEPNQAAPSAAPAVKQ